MPKRKVRTESARERLERIRESLAHEMLDKLDPKVQAAEARRAQHLMAKARAEYDALCRDPAYIARAREASSERGYGNPAAIWAAQRALSTPMEEPSMAQNPIAYIAPGLVTATVNRRSSSFATIHEALTDLGAVPVEPVIAPPPTRVTKELRVPWKEIARRLDIPRYPAQKWRALMAHCRRQPIGSPLHRLLTDRSPTAVENARQAVKLIAR